MVHLKFSYRLKSLFLLFLSFTVTFSTFAFGPINNFESPNKHPEIIPGRKVTSSSESVRGNKLSESRLEFNGDEFSINETENIELGIEKIAGSGYNVLEGPDGTAWYYTAQYEMEDIYYNEYYTDHILHSFTFNIYDNNRRLKGTVRDKIRYADNEIRDRECILDPQVSLHFFNTDDKPEIMVYHAMNTDVYINHYYYSVYSVGGEKDEEGYDKEIYRIEGRCIETLNNSSGSRDENYIFTFVQDPYIDFPANDPNYVEKLNNLSYVVTSYTKAVNDTEGPLVYLSKEIGSTRIPGDTTEGIYFMSKRFDNRLFFIYSQYEKPFFIDPRGSAEDERATPDNALVIEVYETTSETPEYISMTTIPVDAVESEDKLVYTFLSIGSVSWTNDVDMKFHGSPEAPAFIVAKDVALASDIENLISSYYVYDNQGNLVQVIAEDTESMFLYQTGEDQGPIAMFVKTDETGAYLFTFAYLFSGNVLAVISQFNDGDPLYATCVPVKIDGEYKFVFEMKYFDADNAGNFYSRVAWFGSDSQPERIDRIKMGPDVQAAMVYLTTTTVNPTLFDTDEGYEYAVLVKRTYGATIRNEYLIVDDNGGRYATYSADDGKGEPYNLSILPGSPNRMIIQYERGSQYVTLPFTTPSVGGDESGVDNLQSVDADDSPVYYDMQGRPVRNPEKGIYIRKTSSSIEKVIIN